MENNDFDALISAATQGIAPGSQQNEGTAPQGQQDSPEPQVQEPPVVENEAREGETPAPQTDFDFSEFADNFNSVEELRQYVDTSTALRAELEGMKTEWIKPTETTRKLHEYVQDGGSPQDYFSIVSADFSQLGPREKVLESMKYDPAFQGLSADDRRQYLNRQYPEVSQEKIDNLNRQADKIGEDEPEKARQLRQEAETLQTQKTNAELDLKIAANKAAQTLGEIQQKYRVPEAKVKAQNAEQVQQRNLQQAAADVQRLASNFTEMKVGDIDFKQSDPAMATKAAAAASPEAFFSRFVNQDGSYNTSAMFEAAYILENLPSIMAQSFERMDGTAVKQIIAKHSNPSAPAANAAPGGEKKKNAAENVLSQLEQYSRGF